MTQVRRIFGTLVLATLTAVCANATITRATPAKDGGCYLISSAEELYGFAEIVNASQGGGPEPKACGKLTGNIIVNNKVLDENGELVNDVSGLNKLVPIGTSNKPFQGNFDGQGFTISGLYFSSDSQDYIGLFGYVKGSQSTVIQNVGIENSFIKGDESVGGLIGYNGGTNVTLRNCFMVGTVKGGYGVAGLVGSQYGTLSIENSYVLGTVSASSYQGGLIGIGYSASVSNSFYRVNFAGNGSVKIDGVEMPLTAFNDGYVATLLHGENDESIWGQNVTGGDVRPNFSREVIGGPTRKTASLHYADGDVKNFVYYEGHGELPVPSQDGKIFLGWFLSSDFSSGVITEIPADAENDVLVYAKWLEMSEPSVVDNCYQIGTVSELYGFAAIANGTFAENRYAESDACGKLTNDITINSNVLVNGTLNDNHGNFNQWTPIGSSERKFYGTFDGGMHTIYGLYINDENAENVGLFGAVNSENSPTIKQVSIADAYIRASKNVGGLIGAIYYSGYVNISNVSVEGVVGANSNAQYVGGLVGNIIEYYYDEASISMSIDNSYNLASVTGSIYVGGFIGNASKLLKLSVANSYNAGNVSGTGYVGSLAGLVNEYAKVAVEDFYYLNNGLGMNAEKYGNPVTLNQLNYGAVATLLRDGKNGSVWGQRVNVDLYPNFSGVLTDVETLPVITLHYSESNTATLPYVEGIERKLPLAFGGESNNEFAVLGWYDNAELSGTPIKTLSKDASGDKELWAKSLKTDGCLAIGTADDLYEFADRVNEGENTLCAVLVEDIVVNENLLENYSGGDLVNENARRWEPIGSSESPFRGSFDGRGHIISGLYHPFCDDFAYDPRCESRTYEIGLFGRVGSHDGVSSEEGTNDNRDSIVIKNLGIQDSYFKGYGSTGSFVGRMDSSSVLFMANCFSESVISSDGSGFVGAGGGDIYLYNSYFAGEVADHWGDAFLAVTEYQEDFAKRKYRFDNNFSLNVSVTDHDGNYVKSYFAENVNFVAFKNRSVAVNLHNYHENGVDGSIWGQGENDLFPNFSGSVVNPPQPRTIVLHSLGEQQEYSYYENISKKAPVPTEEGYIFRGWFNNENYAGVAYTEIPSNANDLYAKWFKVTKPALVDGCYEIATAEELYGFAAIVNGDAVFSGDVVEKNSPNGNVCGKLVANITVNGYVLNIDGSLSADSGSFISWTPIGSGMDFRDPETEYTSTIAFGGTFNGQNHTISGLYFNDDVSNIGLFGYVTGESVTIENVGVVDSYLKGRSYIGALVGYANGVNANESSLRMTNVFNKATMGGGSSVVGGLVGLAYSTSINIANSYNEGKIYSPNVNEVAGLIGSVTYSNTRLENVYNIGSVVGNGFVAGLIGNVNTFTSNSTYIYNSYNAGTVTGYKPQALIGNHSSYYVPSGSFDFPNSFYLAGMSSYMGGTSKTAAEFANGTVATLLHDYNFNDVDGSVWSQNVGVDEYPRFGIYKTVALHYGEKDKTYKYDVFEKELPDLSEEGYVVAGWYLDADFSGEMLTEIPENATDIYANAFKVTEPATDAENCYAIGTPGELYGFAAIVNGTSYFDGNNLVKKNAVADVCGKLTADIKVNENVLNADGSLSENAAGFAKWTPIGTYDQPFAGSFDGDGHTISGLYFNDEQQDYVGLFGSVNGSGVTASIHKVGLVDSYFRGRGCVGGILGDLEDGASLTLEEVYNAATVVGMGDYIGGIVGEVWDITLNISNVYNMGRISGGECVGGIAGEFYSSQVSVNNVYNAGNVVGKDGAGSIVGYVFDSQIDVNNAYYLGLEKEEYGVLVAEKQFVDGTVATLLHNGKNGSIWGQNVTNDEKYPNFSGEVIGGPTIKTVVLHYDGKEKEYGYVEGLGVLPELTSEGYVAAGWYLNADFSGNPITEIPENAAEGMHIYANAFKVTKPQLVNNCYEIGTSGELYGFAAIVNGTSYYDGNLVVKKSPVSGACGKLTADITVNENVLNADGSLSENASGFAKWTPIGRPGENGAWPFFGSFDGQGHVISGLYINDVSMVYGGLFGVAVGDPVVMIQNLGIEDSYMHVGAIVGGVTGGTFYGALNIENVYSKGVFVAESLDDGGETVGFAGGIVGTTFGGAINISNSYSVATVSCPLNAGMIVGGVMASELENLISVNNAYYNGTANGETIGNYGESKTLDEFGDNTVAKLLHHTCAEGAENCVDGSVWRQGDGYPEFALRTIVLHYGDKTEEYKYLEGSGQLPERAEVGYVFAGWFLNADLSGEPIAEFPENATDIYANAIKVTKPQFADNCYAISNAGELYGFAAIVNGTSYYDGSNLVKNDAVADVCGKLTANITVNKNVLDAEDKLNGNVTSFAKWTPIGKYDIENVEMYPFSGSFDGQGHVVSGLVAEKEDFMTLVGLFGMVASMGESVATIRNVGVTDSYFHAKSQTESYVGGVVGVAMGADLSNVFSRSVLSAEGKMYVGGLVGSCVGGSVNIYNSYSVASLPENAEALTSLYSLGVNINVVNSYYLEGQSSSFGTAKSATDFSDGTVAGLLHHTCADGEENCVDGSIWEQGDTYPILHSIASRVIVLDWNSASDVVVLVDTNFADVAEVRIADGKQFYANGKIYESGVLTSEQIAEIGSNTLYPISGVTFEQGTNGVKATIDAKSRAPLVIPTNIDVSEVALDRTFTRSVFSSIVLPFTIAKENVSGAEFFKFVGIQQDNDGKWGFAVMSKFNDIEANHPYVLMPSAENLTFNSAVTLNTETNHNPQQEGNWKLFGAYESKQWLDGDPEIGRAYGIAAEYKGDNIKPGDFVKVAAGASVSPTRTYLLYSQSTSSRPSAEFGKAGISALPEVIDIVIVDGDEEQPTVIGKFNTRTGEVKAEDNRWFDMKGRVLNTKPTEKGTYFHNGKQVIVK